MFCDPLPLQLLLKNHFFSIFWYGVDLPPFYLDAVFKYIVCLFLTVPLTHHLLLRTYIFFYESVKKAISCVLAHKKFGKKNQWASPPPLDEKYHCFTLTYKIFFMSKAFSPFMQSPQVSLQCMGQMLPGYLLRSQYCFQSLHLQSSQTGSFWQICPKHNVKYQTL